MRLKCLYEDELDPRLQGFEKDSSVGEDLYISFDPDNDEAVIYHFVDGAQILSYYETTVVMKDGAEIAWARKRDFEGDMEAYEHYHALLDASLPSFGELPDPVGNVREVPMTDEEKSWFYDIVRGH